MVLVQKGRKPKRPVPKRPHQKGRKPKRPQNLKNLYEGCSIYNETVLVTFTFTKYKDTSIINIKINHFCSRPSKIREVHQTVMKWQLWQHSHVAVIAPHFLTSRRY